MVDEHATDGNTLTHSITKVHHEGGSTVDKLIDRGKFLVYNRQMPETFRGVYEVKDEE